MKKTTSTKNQDGTQTKTKSEIPSKKTIKEKFIKADAIKEVRIVDDAKWW